MYKLEGFRGYFKGKANSDFNIIYILGNGVNVIRIAPFSAF